MTLLKIENKVRLDAPRGVKTGQLGPCWPGPPVARQKWVGIGWPAINNGPKTVTYPIFGPAGWPISFSFFFTFFNFF